MFRALCAHHQEVEIVLYGIWYHHTCKWPSRAQVERSLCTGRPPTGVTIPDAVFRPPDDVHIVLETRRGTY